jgi:hypothetical protein
MPLGRTLRTAYRTGYKDTSIDYLLNLGPHHLYLPSDLTSVTDAGAGAVSALNDLSRNGHHLAQATAGARPTTGTRSTNGRNMLDYDGGDMLTRTAAIGFDITNFTEFCLEGEDTNVTNSGIIGFHNNGANDYDRTDSLIISNSDNSKLFELNFNNGPSSGAITGAGATPFDLWTVRKEGSNISYWRGNGSSYSSTTWAGGTGIANGGIYLGGRWISSAYGNARLDGPIGIVLGYMRALSFAEIAGVWGWIRGHYGYPK